MQEKIYYDADAVIKELMVLAKNKDYVFRGYGKQTELYPSIIRDTDLRNREIELLIAFEKYGMQYFSVNNAIDFMSYAQHYGLPTRLLDFTYNPFTALFFSLFMPKSSNYSEPEDKDFYYIRYCDKSDQIVFNSLPTLITNADSIIKADTFAFQCKRSIETMAEIFRLLKEKHKENEEGKIEIFKILSYFSTVYRTTHNYKGIENIEDVGLFSPYFDELLDKFNKGKILFIEANQSSSRIIMQQGLFMFPYNLDKKKHKDILVKNTHLLKIHKSTRTVLLDFLENIGIDSFRLMPDLQNVCYAIKRKIIEEKRTLLQL